MLHCAPLVSPRAGVKSYALGMTLLVGLTQGAIGWTPNWGPLNMKIYTRFYKHYKSL